LKDIKCYHLLYIVLLKSWNGEQLRNVNNEALTSAVSRELQQTTPLWA